MKKDFDTGKDQDLRNLLRQLPLQEPSSDFTDSVLARIDAEAAGQVTTYRPLISPWLWLVLVLLLCLAAGSTFFMDMGSAPGWFNIPDWSQPLRDMMGKIATIELSKPLFYGGLALAIAVYVQLYLLKGLFNDSYTTA